MNLNYCVLTGRLTAEPLLRSTASGIPVANLGIAINRVWNDKAGKKQERTDFHNVVVWGKQAVVATKFLVKGQEVLIQGYLRTRELQDNEGKKRFVAEIVADRIHFGRKPKSADVAATEDDQPPLEVGSQEEAELENLPF